MRSTKGRAQGRQESGAGRTVADERPVAPGGRAHAVDTALKVRVHNRLRRIEGQVRGLQQMVEEERYCADILAQMASVQAALRASGRALLENHLRHCARHAFERGSPESDAMIAEIVELVRRHGR
jgi:DNA-binding FrmR family transcriptional regulator